MPLFRLLATNLAVGAAAAVLLLGGLLALNPRGLRDLMLADRSPAIAIGLLLFGLLVTFGSAAMGAAIMALGGRAEPDGSGGGGGGGGRRLRVRPPRRASQGHSSYGEEPCAARRLEPCILRDGCFAASAG